MLLDYFGLWYRKLSGTGGAGAASAGKKKQIYVEQDGKILLFKNARQAAEWVNAQKVAEKNKEQKSPESPKKQVEPKIIDMSIIEPLAIRFDLVLDFKQFYIEQDMESLWELCQRILKLRDEEDIEILLLAT